MKRLILLGVSVAAALAVAVSSADAELIKKKKRPSLLESLFGAGSFEGNRRERNLRKPRRNWWEQGSGFGLFGNDRSRWARQQGPVAFIDPEEVAGHGMGNLTYALPKTHAVYDSSFGKLSTSETAPSFIRLALSDKDTAIRASDNMRKVVLEHYRSAGFKPLWTEKGMLSPRGEELLQVLATAGQEGLNSERYLPTVLSSYAEAGQQIAHDGVALAQLDVGLTVSALVYARHLSGGAIEPQLLSRYHDISPEYADPAVALKVLAYSPYPASYLKGLAPTHPAYGTMKAELAALSAQDTKVRPFPSGKRVKIGQQDERIPLLRARIEAKGFVPSNAADIGDDAATTLDKHLSMALKAYQQAKNIAQTGQLDQNTVRALNGGESGQELQEKLIANMERLRWLPKNLGYRHVLVNQAAFTVKVIENGKSAWASKVIVGKPMTQTAVFSDEMETVVFNPTWGVPQSILLNEYLPKLRRDPSYLDRNGFHVVNANGKRVSSRAVNWYGVGSGSGIGVVQPPGGGNALGEIKFLFPNSHSIYMHDTPNRELFAETQRSFSHGCVRVENPREFAQVLLNWEAEKVASKVEAGQTSSVKITNPVKVHLTYFTAWPDDSGKIQYFSDIYERDQALIQAFRTTAQRFARKQVPQLVQNANSQPVVKID
jgi:L,D-transpeptidase YcbB